MGLVIVLLSIFLFLPVTGIAQVSVDRDTASPSTLDPKLAKELELTMKKIKSGPTPQNASCENTVTPLNLLNYNRVNALTMFVVFPKMNTHAATESSLTASMNTSNVWTPTVYVVPKSLSDGDVYFVCPPDECPMLDDLNKQSPIQFHNMTEEEFAKKAKVFHADGVVRQYKLKYEKPLKKSQSVSLEIGLTQLVNGNDGLGPSDHFIESAHKSMDKFGGHGNTDPFSRSKYAYEKSGIYIRDGEKPAYELQQADQAGVARIDYVKSIDFMNPEKKRLVSLNFGTTAGGAFGKKGREFNPDVQFGASVDAVVSKGFSARRSVTAGLGVAASKTDAIHLGTTKAPDMGLKKTPSEAHFMLAGSKTTQSGNLKTTIGGAAQIHSVLLDQNYEQKTPVRDPTKTVESQRYYRGSIFADQLFNKRNIMMQAYLDFEFKKQRMNVQIWGAEDSSPSNNAEDFNWGVSVKKTLGTKKPIR